MAQFDHCGAFPNVSIGPHILIKINSTILANKSKSAENKVVKPGLVINK